MSSRSCPTGWQARMSYMHDMHHLLDMTMALNMTHIDPSILCRDEYCVTKINTINYSDNWPDKLDFLSKLFADLRNS